MERPLRRRHGMSSHPPKILICGIKTFRSVTAGFPCPARRIPARRKHSQRLATRYERFPSLTDHCTKAHPAMTLNRKLASMIAVLWIGLILIGGFGAWQNRASMISDRRDQLKSLIDQANHIVGRYYALAQQHTLSEDEAKKQALDMLASMRYGKAGYISVNDSQPVILMHPIKPELNGKNVAQFTDPLGNHLFVDMVNQGNHEGGGFVDYLWAKPGSEKPVAKTSYSARFAPWDWYLVTGMYMDDVQSAFYANLLSWLAITVTLGALATVVMLGVLRSIRRTLGGDLEVAVEHAQLMARGNLATRVQVDSRAAGSLLHALQTMPAGLVETVALGRLGNDN